MTTLYMVLPCYNEEAVLPETAKRLKAKYAQLQQEGRISEQSRIVFVDDGSKDKTWQIISDLHKSDKVFSGIKQSRNRGHQNAVWCGLMTVRDLCDAAISMDADLQDDIEAIDKMLDKFDEGCEVVYGVRSSRESDTFFKRTTAEGYYTVMEKLGVDLVFNHADFRLMSRRAMAALSQFKEVNLFLRGMVPLVGFKSDVVTYERSERFAGESKYPLSKMLALAFEGVTSFSVKPIKWISGVGIAAGLLGLVLTIVNLVRMGLGAPTAGLAALVSSLWIMGGLVLLAVGIVGSYVGKAYLETKGRPRYIVEEFLHEDGDEKTC